MISPEQAELDLVAAFYAPYAQDQARAAELEDYALEILDASDFADRRVAALLDAWKRAKCRGLLSEVLMLLERSEVFRLPEQGWVDFILEHQQRFVSPEHIPFLAQSIYRTSRIRQAASRLADVGAELPDLDLAMAYQIGGVGKLGDLNGRIADLIEDIDPPEYRSDFATSVQRTAKQHTEQVEKPRIHCGIRALRHLYLKPGHVVVLGAARSAGKSTFGQHIAMSAADAGHPSLIVTLEMPAQEVEERMLCAAAPCTSEDLEAPHKSESLKAKIREAAQILASKPIAVEACGHSAGSVYAAIERHVRKRDVRVVVVDFIQEISEREMFKRSRNDEIGLVMSTLKDMAVKRGLTIVALSQINRQGVEQPEMHHLRDSGTIEQGADEIVLVWKVDAELDDAGLPVAGQSPLPGVYARLAKHRGGATSVAWTPVDVDFPTFRIEPQQSGEAIYT